MSADAQLASPHAGIALLAELAFSTGVQRFTTWTHALDWLGYTWGAVQAIVSVTPIKASEELSYPALDIGLNIANSALLAVACNSVPSTYRGRPITLYLGVLDDEFRKVDDPEIAWVGRMDQIRVATPAVGAGGEGGGSIVLRCEPHGKDKRAAMSLRLNHAQHSRRYPGDTLLSRVEALSGKPVPWLSKRFQQI